MLQGNPHLGLIRQNRDSIHIFILFLRVKWVGLPSTVLDLALFQPAHVQAQLEVFREGLRHDAMPNFLQEGKGCDEEDG